MPGGKGTGDYEGVGILQNDLIFFYRVELRKLSVLNFFECLDHIKGGVEK